MVKTPSLLSKERGLVVSPTLAVIIGDRQALLLQQIQYWLDINEKTKKTNNHRDGRWWTYNTYEAWIEESFPFWNVRMLRRLMKDLEDRGLVIARKFESSDWKQRKWYTINYDAVEALNKPETIEKQESAKLATSNEPPRADHLYTETTTEITQEEYRKVFPEETTAFNNSFGENNQEGEPPTSAPPVDISDYRQTPKPKPPKPLYKGESELGYDEYGWIQLPTTRGTAAWMRECCSYTRVQTMSWIKEWMINSYPEALDLSFGHNHAGETIVRMFDGSWTPYEQFVSPNGPMPAKVMRDLLSARMPLFIDEFNEQTQAYWDEAWENFKYLIAPPCIVK